MAALVDALTGFPQQPYIVLGAMQSPGVATVKGLDSPREWDIRQGYGFSGATVVFKGTGLSKFSVDIDLWLPEHFILWNVFAAILVPPLPGPAGFALGIQHPIINGPPHGIHEVVVENVSQPVQSDLGKWTYTIAFLQYRKPLPALSRPIAAIPAVGTPQPTAQDQNEVKMKALAAEAKALGG
jgi:hypothetical protein